MGTRARTYLTIALLLLVGLAVPVGAGAHLLDHPVPTIAGPPPGPLSTNVNAGGDGARWELLASLPTTNAQSDLDFFTKNGETYASVGALGVNVNGGGQNIVKLTEGGRIARGTPRLVSNHPSAACPADPTGSLGLQHDVEAVPKGTSQAGVLNTDVPAARLGDAQLLLDASDAGGRCHDQGTLGVQDVPRGGLEIIDVSDIGNPVEIGFTSHIGESHTVNVDPRRPHIAYSVTSDAVGVNAAGKRANETGTGRALDGFEIVNLRSCLTAPLGTIPAGASLAEKRASCRPEVFRFRYPNVEIALGHTNRSQIYGCHETEVYPDDTLTCGGGAAAIAFDLAGMFDDAGTPGDFTDDRIKGTPLPCRVRPSSNAGPSAAFTTGAMVTDCVAGGTDAAPVDLGIPNWLRIGSPSATGIQHLGSAFHFGRESSTGAVRPAQPATQDIDFDHEAEFTDSRRLIISTDERGGGVTGGAQCSPGADLDFANGGLHAYRVDRLEASTPNQPTVGQRAESAFAAYAKDSKGNKAIFRTPVQTGPQGSFCTAHVFQQIPGQNRIFMGWYSQGTQVVDFTENADGTVDFKRAGYFIPEGANQWVSSVFKTERNADGTFTYYGATGDGIVGASGRNGIDVYKVTLPAPPQPAARVAKPAPKAPVRIFGPDATTPGASTATCTARNGFVSAGARGRGTGVAFSLARRTSAKATVDVFQQSVGRRITGERRVRRFTNRTGAFRWDGRDSRGRRLPDGYYFARFRVEGANGTADTIRITLRKSGGRYSRRAAFFGRESCGTLQSFKLIRPVFGGTRRRGLGISYRLNESARVGITVLRGKRVIKRFSARSVTAGRTIRQSLAARRLGAGDYRVRLSVTKGGRTSTSTLTSRKL